MSKKLSFFLYSSILNKKIYDEYNDVMGILKDVYINVSAGYPKIVGYKVKNDNGTIDFEFKNINFVQEDNGKIRIESMGSREILPRDYNYLLTRDILDKKIVDINGRKVVKVEDIRIAMIKNEYRIIAIETGKFVRYRRKGMEGIGKILSTIFKKEFEERAIMWDDVEALDTENGSLQIGIPYKKIQALHPADIADILEELDEKERKSIFESLDEELAADTFEEADPELQGSILKELSDMKTAELFENIPNDEIADILDDLNEEHREKVLTNIEREDAQEIEELLAYDEKSIGSIMNTDYISINYGEMTVGELISLLKETEPEEEGLYNIYITDSDGKLMGYVEITKLLINPNAVKLTDIMENNPISISYKDNVQIATEFVEKYALISIPVVDEEQVLIGAVLMYDIIDEIYAPGHRKNK
ncbi:MAG: magnesium transporter [Sarcina sp.]